MSKLIVERISRRKVMSGAATAGIATAVPSATHAWFFAGMLARSLTSFVGRTAAVNSARVGLSGLSAVARARTATASAALRSRGAMPREGVLGTYNREFAGGIGNEMGKAAGRAVVRALGQGWGEVRGRGRPIPTGQDEDDVFVVFPNDGYDRPAILGCPEIALLEIMLDVVARRFITRGYDVTPHHSTAMLFPLVGLEHPTYDDIWNSRTSTLYESALYVVRHTTSGMRTQRAHVRTTVWRNTDFGSMSNVPFTSRAPDFEDNIPLN
jgi:hypothetical protein